MQKKFLSIVLLLNCLFVKAQYKNDNVLFKTVDPSELCATLEKNKGYLLLDVRSPGEHNDTSTSPKYNLGHLKGARNIDVSELDKRLSELQQYKDKPVFVYCSHSQRSRRASKTLVDSGFTKVFNVNGGMTAIYYTGAKEMDCLKTLVETSNPYRLISANELCAQLAKQGPPFILDVRSDSAFRHISRNAKENAAGFFSGTVNIPLNVLPDRLNDLPKEQNIVITDLNGDDAARASVFLNKKGFKNVAVLIEGIDRVLSSDEQDLWCKNGFLYQSPVTYKMLSSAEFGRFAKTNTGYLPLDIRTKAEVANTDSNYWKNIGHLKNSINIPAAELDKNIEQLKTYKDKEIVIYSFGSGSEIFAAAERLQKAGFKKVNVLVGGIFTLRWTAANVKGQSYLTDLVEGVPEINW